MMPARLSCMFTAAALMLAACGRSATPPRPTAAPSATTTSVPHAAEIRFGLVGSLSDVNVWSLFDVTGQSYDNYAVMSPYWPRLYQLSIPGRDFEPMAAGGMPSAFQPQGGFYTASVPLRTDLKWTDGTPFSADDVAFTVNTVLSFELGFDWHDYYDPDLLDHAEAVDARTVRFYFKKQPEVGAWQYGALQGPIVQKDYWSPRIAAPAALLPAADLGGQIASLQAQAADIQSKIQALNIAIATAAPGSQQQKEAENELKSRQDDLNQADSSLGKLQSQHDSAIDAARRALYALPHANEPTLGDWLPAGEQKGAWINRVNPAHPFNTPKFDQAQYVMYPDEATLLSSFQRDDLNAVLEPAGLSVGAAHADFGATLVSNPNRLAHFLLLNPRQPAWSDPILRRALSCSLDRQALADRLGAYLLDSFLPGPANAWRPAGSALSCGNAGHLMPRAAAVSMLKAAGYTWVTEPSAQGPGQGLAPPHGAPFSPQALLAPAQASDPQMAQAAGFVQEAANYLGLPVSLQSADAAGLRYAVFSSGQYDLALLGWRVGEYPIYLCDWFRSGNPFGYHSDRLDADCAALNSTADLGAAHKALDDIQAVLIQDLPFIPLYAGLTSDATRNIEYPFGSLLNGLSGVYGAPALAIPAAQP
jgi:ABC-type transport system substrate-binding protein